MIEKHGKKLFMILILVSMIILGVLKSNAAQWNSSNVKKNLRYWLYKTRQGSIRDCEIRRWDFKSRRYRDYRTGHERDDEDHELKGGLTIGKFYGNKPVKGHFMWQWRGGRMIDGFLYGRIDGHGEFTGNDICFIYPDLKTGLQGQFINGRLIEAKAVEIIGER